MSRTITAKSRRELRRIVGPEFADLVVDHNASIIAMASVLNRGFWGRLRWLLTGK